jgi:hypothetical protein
MLKYSRSPIGKEKKQILVQNRRVILSLLMDDFN